MRSKTLFLNTLVWLFFMLHGTVYLSLLPLWEGFDEWLHYSYIAYLSKTGKIPNHSLPTVPKEILESLKIVPGSFENNHIKFKPFWDSSEKLLKDQLNAINSLRNIDKSPFTISNWQSQHPPLYYLFISPFYKIYKNSNLGHTALTLRWISIILVSMGFIPLYVLFRIFFNSAESSLGLLLLGVYPSTFILFGHLTNDCLAFPLFSTLILLCVLQLKNGIIRIYSILTGVLLGLGILTKLYFLTAALPIFAIYLRSFLLEENQKKWEPINNFLILSLIAGALSLPWFLHNWNTYGTWNATVHATAIKDFSFFDKIHTLGSVNWKSFIVSNIIGLLWAGNWSFVSFPNLVYKGFALCLAMIAVIFGFKLIKDQPVQKKMDALLALFSISFFFGLFQHQLQIRMAGNMDSMGGWYWTILLPNHILIFMLSLKFITKKYFHHFLIMTAGLCFVVTLWGELNFLLPYYTGFFEKEVINHNFINIYPFFSALQRISSLNAISNNLIFILLFLEILLFITTLFFLFFYLKNEGAG